MTNEFFVAMDLAKPGGDISVVTMDYASYAELKRKADAYDRLFSFGLSMKPRQCGKTAVLNELRPKMVKRVCRNRRCKKEFEAREADVKRGWGKFCSKSCKAAEQEKRTGQYADYKVRQQCREEHGFTPVIFGDKGEMFAADGQGVDRYGHPCFIGVTGFDNTEHQNSDPNEA